MNRLVNALAFAAVVIAAFVMDSNLPQRLASCPRVARVVQAVRGHDLPAVGSLDGLPPHFDQARLDRAMERMQAAQERMARVDMRRVEMRVQAAQRAVALSNCKVIKIDQ
jgi:uncharacterized protein YqgV (UPF0045/DUF77 family)